LAGSPLSKRVEGHIEVTDFFERQAQEGFFELRYFMQGPKVPFGEPQGQVILEIFDANNVLVDSSTRSSEEAVNAGISLNGLIPTDFSSGTWKLVWTFLTSNNSGTSEFEVDVNNIRIRN